MTWQHRGRSKYGAIKTVVNGITFSSKREAARYCALLLELKAGKITNLTLQPRYELQPKFDSWGKHYRAISYVGDFEYVENGSAVVEDVKGFVTPIFSIKEKMFRFKYSYIKLRISK